MASQRAFTMPGGVPFESQLENVRFIFVHDGQAIIGDVRGLGKTCSALIWLQVQPRLRPVIIVCPAQVKSHWARQIQRWMGVPEDDITVLSGRKPRDLSGNLIIINYDILSAWGKKLAALQPKCVILDECQRVKHRARQRSKAAAALCALPSVRSRIGLTGTVFMSRPKEGWHQVHVINPEVFPSEWQYLQRYCDPQQINTTAQRDEHGQVLRDETGKPIWNTAWQFNGASNVDDLARILRTRVMIRHEQSPDVPKVIRDTIPLECNLTDYQAVRRDVRVRLAEIKQQMQARRLGWQALSDPDRTRAIAQTAEHESLIKLYGLAGAEIAKLRKAAGLAKIDAVCEWLEDFLEEQNPVLLFAHHHEVLDGLRAKLNQTYELNIPPALDGRMGLKARDCHAQAFVDRQTPVLLAGLTALSEGFDGLQYASNHLAFIELGWTPGTMDQSEGRLDRQGQPRRPVLSYYLIAPETIDQDMARLLDAKTVVTTAAHGDDMPPPGILESLVDSVLR